MPRSALGPAPGCPGISHEQRRTRPCTADGRRGGSSADPRDEDGSGLASTLGPRRRGTVIGGPTSPGTGQQRAVRKGWINPICFRRIIVMVLLAGVAGARGAARFGAAI